MMRRVVTQKQLDDGFIVRYQNGQEINYYYIDERLLPDGTYSVVEPEVEMASDGSTIVHHAIRHSFRKLVT